MRRRGVLEAGVANGWIRQRHSLIPIGGAAYATGSDPAALLRGCAVRLHLPDEEVARQVTLY